jgi:predicted SprT family Zn-dependent metalloprotease
MDGLSGIGSISTPHLKTSPVVWLILSPLVLYMLMLGEKEQVFFSEKLSSQIDRVADTGIIPRVGFRFLLFSQGVVEMESVMLRQMETRRLMNAHGLRGWRLKVDNAKKRFGQCCYSTQTISIAQRHYEVSPWSEVLDTVLHEIAHALVGPGHGHDRVWKAKCVEIGANPVRCGKTATEGYHSDASYSATCAGCGHTHYRYRRPRAGRRYWCKCARVTLTWVAS